MKPQNRLFDFTGQFDEKVFVGLDFVLAEAGRRGLKLILALTNYWTPFGGMAQYVKYVSEQTLKQFFCTSRHAATLDHHTHVVASNLTMVTVHDQGGMQAPCTRCQRRCHSFLACHRTLS